MRNVAVFWFAWVIGISGCGDDDGPPAMPDGGGGEVDGAAEDGAAGPDGETADAPPGEMCTTDDDCDDGVFCNGVERCLPGTDGADARGCVAAPAPVDCSD